MYARHLKSDAAPLDVRPARSAISCHFDIKAGKDKLSKFINSRLHWMILMFGGLLSSWAAWNIGAQIEREALATFQIHALDFETSVAGRLRSYEDILFGVAGLYQHSDKEVTTEEFNAYAQSLDLDKRYPALDNLNYAKYFPASEREQFLGEVRKELGAARLDLVSQNLAPGSNEYMIITRAYPTLPRSLGFNVMTTSHRLAKDSVPPLSSSLYKPNTPISSGVPVRAPSNGSASLGVRLGIFGTGAWRGSRLIGTAGIVLNVEEFFNEALPARLANRIAYRVETIGRSDGKRYARPAEIFSTATGGSLPRPLAAAPADLMTASFTVPFGGALLRVEMSEEKSLLVGRRDQALPFAVLARGLLFFGMAAVLSRRTLERNRELVQAMTVQAADLRREIDRARQLEQELAHVIEEERRRIGYELHDDLGQRLTGMSLSFKALSETLHSVSADLSAQADALERTTSEAISSVRGLAHGLMPVPAGRGGLLIALEQLAARVSASHAMRCMFDFDDPVDIENDTVATNLYRIAQEAVNNAIRHARASVVKIRLDEEQGKVTLTINDNGVGFPHERCCDDQPVQLAGAGLRIMAHRASVINYKLDIDSSIGDGTTIKAQQC